MGISIPSTINIVLGAIGALIWLWAVTYTKERAKRDSARSPIEYLRILLEDRRTAWIFSSGNLIVVANLGYLMWKLAANPGVATKLDVLNALLTSIGLTFVISIAEARKALENKRKLERLLDRIVDLIERLHDDRDAISLFQVETTTYLIEAIESRSLTERQKELLSRLRAKLLPPKAQ